MSTVKATVHDGRIEVMRRTSCPTGPKCWSR